MPLPNGSLRRPELCTRWSPDILPITNLGRDPEQEYFTDGITEDIITALSRLRWFFVIARTSTFGYKGQGIDVLGGCPDYRPSGIRHVGHEARLGFGTERE